MAERFKIAPAGAGEELREIDVELFIAALRPVPVLIKIEFLTPMIGAPQIMNGADDKVKLRRVLDDRVRRLEIFGRLTQLKTKAERKFLAAKRLGGGKLLPNGSPVVVEMKAALVVQKIAMIGEAELP